MCQYIPARATTRRSRCIGNGRRRRRTRKRRTGRRWAVCGTPPKGTPKNRNPPRRTGIKMQIMMNVNTPDPQSNHQKLPEVKPEGMTDEEWDQQLIPNEPGDDTPPITRQVARMGEESIASRLKQKPVTLKEA